jgi:uncharacterized membrane protein YphA (DoxX/SURF4 family)
MGELLGVIDQPHAQFLMRVVLGGLLLLAGITKLADRAAFRDAMHQYEILPPAFEAPFAAFVPFAEATLGGLLLVGLGTTAAAALAVPLLGSFVVAIGVNLARGRDFDCHCFGAVQSDRIGWPVLLRSALLVLIALTVALGTSSFGALDGALRASEEGLPPLSDVIPLAIVAFAIFDVLILLPETFAMRETIAAAFRVRITGAHSHGHQHPVPTAGNGRNSG